MMSHDIVQSTLFIVFGLVLVLILLPVLAIVHKQAQRVRELEMRMKAVDEMDIDQTNQNITDREEN